MQNKIAEILIEPTKIYVGSTFLLKIKIEDELLNKKYIATKENKILITENGKKIKTEWS